MTDPLVQYKSLWTSLEPKAVELVQLHRTAGRAGRPISFFAKALGIPVSKVKSLANAYPTLFEINGTRLAVADAARPFVQEFLTKSSRPCDIHFLFDYLDGLDPARWRDLFPCVAAAQPTGQRRWKELLSVVRHIYGTPVRVVAFIEELPVSDDHRAVFRLVYESPEGMLPFDEIAAAFDFHQSKLEHVLLELEQHAVLFERYEIGRYASPRRSYSLLKELAQFLASQRRSRKRGSRKPPVPLSKAPARVADEELNLAYSVSCLVAHLRTHSIRLTRNRLPHRTDLRKLDPLLNLPETSRIDGQVICRVATQAGLAEPDRDNRRLVLTDRADRFAQQDMLARQKMLFDSMVRTQSALSDVQPDAAALLSKLDTDVWYKLAEVTKFARRLWLGAGQEPETFRLCQHGPNWYYSLPPEQTARIDALKAYIAGPLCLAGGVRMSLAETEPERMSLTPLGLYLMGMADAEAVDMPAASTEERGLIVQPNLQVVVDNVRFDPIHYALLDTFCTRDGSGWATVFQLDKQSVAHGIQMVGSVDPFIEFLRQHNKHGELPGNVVSVLRGWDSGMKRVKVRRVGLVEADDDLVLMELLSRKKFNKYLDKGAKPTRFVVFDSISAKKLKQLLEDEGYLVEE